jgi:pimeloyl-ACP methyl ester carboxylesterase/membrane protease YdiL (CAAX protease family)
MLALVRRRPLVVYFVLAYVLAWALFPLIEISQLFGLLGLFAPALAAVLTSALVGGRGQVSSLLRSLSLWRVGAGWYALALGLPILISLAILGVAILGGAPTSIRMSPISALSALVFVLVVGEELGWRGFAQPTLERSRTPLVAAITVGILWGFWHLPTFLLPGLPQAGIPFPAFLAFTTAASIVLAWLMRRSGGSVIIATLFHGSFNTFGFLTPSLTLAERWWLTAVIYSLAATLVVVLDKGMAWRSSSPAERGGPVKPTNRVRSVLGRGLRTLVVVLVGLSFVGVIYEAISQGADRRAYPPAGQMVEVDGRSIHMLVAGSDTGKPTVILEAGIASFSSNWVRVQDGLAAETQVVSYDRAGLGWSDAAPDTQDAAQSAADLHAALQAVGIPAPYVVVGHSYGGLVVRAFADLYPDQVVGMVLVDASHPDQWAALSIPGGSKLAALGNWILGVMARLGLVRLLGMNVALSAGLPERQAVELAAALARPQSWFTSGDIIAIWDSRSGPLINQAADLGHLPLAVISAPERPSAASLGGYADLLNAQQAQLAALSSNSLHMTVEGATHESLVNEAEYAQVVADGILRVVEAAVTGVKLSAGQQLPDLEDR